ncbi:MAG: hypothetical protein K6A77_03370 [Clostridiales bacterium]|nr:hypothetical protein [Clostridiales bacterium]
MMRRWICIGLMLVLVIGSAGCGKKNIFSQQTIPVIVSLELEIKDTVSVKRKIVYDDHGMPSSFTTETLNLYDPEAVPELRTATITYDPKERRIRTSNLSTYYVESDSGEANYVPITQNYWFDAEGRLLKTENAHENTVFSYDDQSRITGASAQFTDYGNSMETTFVTGESGLKSIEKRNSETYYTMQGSYDRNPRGDLTYIHEFYDWAYPDYKSHIEKTMTCSYDDKGRVLSQKNIYNDIDASIRENEIDFTYEGDSFDVKRIDLDEMDLHLQFEYQYENDLLKQVTITQGEYVTTKTYSYDTSGRLMMIETEGDSFHEIIRFEQKQVTDPVIASFLRLKPEYLTGNEDDASSMFVLAADTNLWNEHYCYMCGRELPFSYQTCPYCGTKVNSSLYYAGDYTKLPPNVGMANLWTIDGELLR